MKLITELVEDVQYIIEGEGEKKKYFIEGVFMQGDIKNRNGRMYPRDTLHKEMTRYNTEYVEKNRAFGELGHPNGPTINLERVSHIIKELKEDGSNVIGKAKILDTPFGTIVKNLIDEGAQLGVSSRGMGTLKLEGKHGGAQVVQSDFMLSTAADIVADPSAPNAFVNGVMEGVDWVYDAATGQFSHKAIEEIVETGKRSVQELHDKQLVLFEKFLKTL